MFDPTIGRWLTQDPIGFSAEDTNLYRYVGNSPTNATDPSGLVSRKGIDALKADLKAEYEKLVKDKDSADKAQEHPWRSKSNKASLLTNVRARERELKVLSNVILPLAARFDELEKVTGKIDATKKAIAAAKDPMMKRALEVELARLEGEAKGLYFGMEDSYSSATKNMAEYKKLSAIYDDIYNSEKPPSKK